MLVCFYGSLSDRIGADAPVEVPPGGCRVAEVRRRLAARHPAHAEDLLRPSLRASINDAVVGEDAWILPDDRLEFLPPLSGG